MLRWQPAILFVCFVLPLFLLSCLPATSSWVGLRDRGSRGEFPRLARLWAPTRSFQKALNPRATAGKFHNLCHAMLFVSGLPPGVTSDWALASGLPPGVSRSHQIYGPPPGVSMIIVLPWSVVSGLPPGVTSDWVLGLGPTQGYPRPCLCLLPILLHL